MVAIQVLSDLHLESPKSYDLFEIEPTAPYLALLGDIGNIERHKDDCLAFLEKQLHRFSAVLFVPGNHEAYDSSWPATLAILQAFEEDTNQDSSITGRFILLDRRAYKVPNTNVTIVGCSLFSHVPQENAMDVEMGLNDFFQTGDWNTETHNASHQRDLAWLNQVVEKLEQQSQEAEEDSMVVIMTHWCPARDPRASQPQHAGSKITTGFSTDLSRETCFISTKVKAWAFGHTHYNCDFVVERDGGKAPLRLLANQRGYYFAQAVGFDVAKTIEI